MRSALIAVVAAATFFVAPAFAAAWQSFVYPDLAFGVDFPAQPTRQDKGIETDGGGVPTVFIYVPDSGRVYFTSSSDLSANPGMIGPEADLARAVLDGAIKDRTVVAGPTPVRAGSHQGWEVTSSDEKDSIRLRTFVTGKRAFTVMVVVPAGSAELLTDADSARFFASFHITQ